MDLIFHNGSNYDYHFIIELTKEFFKKITCLGENTKKCITFTPSWKILVPRMSRGHPTSNVIRTFPNNPI